MEQNNLLTLEEEATLLKVPPSWLYDKTRRKGPDMIPHIKIGKYCRFVHADVLAWCRKRQAA